MNSALVLGVVVGGPEAMVVSGAAVSTVQLYDAGVWSVFPAPSVARTEKVCGPAVSPA
jgi:hypothetical protein